MALPSDATIADVMSRPTAPATEYVRKIVEHMWDCKRQFGDPLVRIGVTGEGRAPNYRIEYTKVRWTPKTRQLVKVEPCPLRKRRWRGSRT